METAPLKDFATWARRELITQVNARLTAVLAPASPWRIENKNAVDTLERDIAAAGGGAKGKDAIADKVAYIWFNRIIALRFMDANGYTDIGVVSPIRGEQVGQPEVLAEAKRGIISPTVVSNKHTLDTITGLLDGTRPSSDAQGEAYTLLLAEYCRFWNRFMPFMFETEGDYTELLIPANLLAADSILTQATAVLTEEVCRDVEVIGWLYQFYISERKDEVFASFKKGKKAGASEIPAATQLFTPHWIVRYLVENSLGRLWMLNNPSSQLAEQMDYYITPVDQETDFLEVSSPEELTIIDPACGSGHMLTYAFDLLYAIYEEEGYAPSEIPGLILTHNLYGTEIDQRAGSLAAFALTMKARSKKRTFFSKPVQPNICVLKPISFTPDELKNLATKDGDLFAESEYWNQFTHADLFGSLIHPDPELTQVLKAHLATLDDGGKLGSFCIGIDPLGSDLFEQELLERARTVIAQAEYLSESYHIAIANPPYMGSKQMNSLLSQFMKQEYPTGNADLMTAFMARAQTLIPRYGIWAMINLPSWMSLKSFEDLRQDLLRNQTISSMVHLGRGIFGSDFGTVAFVINNAPPKSVRGVYRRLFEQHVEVRSVAAIETLFHDSAYNRYEICQTDFAEIPGSPIVYWLSEKMRATFKSGRPLSEVANLRQGLATGENNRFLRLWWEVAQNRSQYCATSIETAHSTECKWFPYNKGGEFRKWYGNQEYVIAFDSDNYAILSRQGNHLPSRQYYFSPSVSWSKISSGSPAFRAYPPGFIFDVAGTSIFADTETKLAGVLAFTNSQVALEQLAALAPTLNYEVGQVASLPIKESTYIDEIDYARHATAEAKADWDTFEFSWNFSGNPLVALVKSR